LKTAFEAKNADDVKAKTEALDAAWMAASEELYAAGQQPGADAGAQNGGNAGGEKMYRMQTSKKSSSY
jgi:molecular chaperone DnaK